MLRQKLIAKPSPNRSSWLIFGKVLRSDKDSEFQVYKVVEDDEPVRIRREFINERRRVCLGELEEGSKYIVATFGDKVAGVATSHMVDLVAPFKCMVDAPIDHSKDWMKLSIPANVPVSGDLARAIKASLR